MWLSPAKKSSRKSTLVGLNADLPGGPPKPRRSSTLVGLNGELPGGPPKPRRPSTLIGLNAPLPGGDKVARRSSTLIGLCPPLADADKSARRSSTLIGLHPKLTDATETPRKSSTPIGLRPTLSEPAPSLRTPAAARAKPHDESRRVVTLRMKAVPQAPSPRARDPEPILPQVRPPPWPYRRAAYAVLGMGILLLFAAGASAALQHHPAFEHDPLVLHPIANESRVDMVPATPSAAWNSARSDDGAPAVIASPSIGSAADFSRDRAEEAIADATKHIDRCNMTKSAMQTHVRVTFAPTGHVESASVLDRPYATNLIGRCISSQLHRASVPAFRGHSQTVTTLLVSP
jgi:hypothetical protein